MRLLSNIRYLIVSCRINFGNRCVNVGYASIFLLPLSGYFRTFCSIIFSVATKSINLRNQFSDYANYVSSSAWSTLEAIIIMLIHDEMSRYDDDGEFRCTQNNGDERITARKSLPLRKCVYPLPVLNGTRNRS